MASATLSNLQRLLEAGKESALLRFSLGAEHLKAGEAASAIEHLQRAVQLDPEYSAAWKLLGRALAESGHLEEAVRVYDEGMAVAERRGDKQAAKEMGVFGRRLRRQLQPPQSG